MWENILNSIVSFCTTAGIKLLLCIAILVLGLKFIKIFIEKLKKGKGFNKIEPSVQSFIKSFLSIGLKVLLFITIAAILGVPMTSVVTVLASASLAVGLALQGSLSNLAGGIMILIFKPFKVGDYIDTHTDSGTVKEINIFYTVLITPDNRQITLPNGTLSNSSVINYSTEETRRVDLAFSVSYNADIDAVISALKMVASAHPSVLKEPEPFARLKEQGESALIFTLRVWCKTEDYWNVNFDLNENVKKMFDRVGIEIPYPQLDVHMDK